MIMHPISSLVDLAGVGLSVEQVKSYAASQNIANVNNSSYVTKAANFSSLLQVAEEAAANKGVAVEDLQNKEAFVVDQPNKKISLDEEVLNLSNAELRYQVTAQIIQKKFGIMDLALGSKK